MAKIKELPASAYHFSFYATDCREPMHVHVRAQGKEAKIWVRTLNIAFNKGFRSHELHEILRFITLHKATIIREWEAFCNPSEPDTIGD